MKKKETNQPPTYEIRTISDFLLVPAERRSACLLEFGTWLSIHDPLMQLLTPPEHPGSVKFTFFRWIDDGKREVSIILDESEPVVLQ